DSALQAGFDVAVFEADVGVAERGVDVAIGVENVFDDPIGPAGADALELRTDHAADAGEAVTGRTVADENLLAFGRRGLRVGECGAALLDQLFKLLVPCRQTFR